jgi:predicted NUDIX family NTP pyrophosphohydrolase
MPPRVSAGLIMYRLKNGALQVFLAHPGGPLYAHKDDGHWSIPKGEPPEGEALFDAAKREFEEETGLKPQGPFAELGSIRQKGGKIVHAWAFEGDCDDSQPICSNLFEMEWPPRSGRSQSFPEVDRAQFFPLPEAKQKLRDSQWPLVERLAAILGSSAKNDGQ